jgi:hypothetical protein
VADNSIVAEQDAGLSAPSGSLAATVNLCAE